MKIKQIKQDIFFSFVFPGLIALKKPFFLMTYDRPGEEDALFNNDMLRWSSSQQQQQQQHPMGMEIPLQAAVSSGPSSTTVTAVDTATTISVPTGTPLPAINTTNPVIAPPPPILDPSKQYHPEWGVIKDQDFHPLTLKHQRDLENSYSAGSAIADFYFWQANLGGYCMADMVQGREMTLQERVDSVLTCQTI